ncbi:MAG: glycosyltransferase family 2 protein [Candidatus Nanopelagicales bacterium]|nr:glycosyltransferase family 2 protein [Candidatus Nanopelagicales bacterium]MDZ4248976.1 glycosyltransferase family 2 protein [Candidatus Nanopelagicales bacterium]
MEILQIEHCRRLVAILACHNRREVTLKCLASLEDQRFGEADVAVVLIDDGSTDGTGEAVARRFPNVDIVRTPGDYYWAKSMALAEHHAHRMGSEVLLWLNDDVTLAPDAVARLWKAHLERPEAILVGATVDPESGRCSYGGKRRTGRHPMRFTPVPVRSSPVRVDTFNGNVVLVPWSARHVVGPIDGEFAHAYADTDYGLRARKLGVEIIQVAGSVGECRANVAPDTRAMKITQRWKWLTSPKGLPLGSQARFMKRHGGPEWPAYFIYGAVRGVLAGTDYGASHR